jgi:hypothetical protein
MAHQQGDLVMLRCKDEHQAALGPHHDRRGEAHGVSDEHAGIGDDRHAGEVVYEVQAEVVGERRPVAAAVEAGGKELVARSRSVVLGEAGNTAQLVVRHAVRYKECDIVRERLGLRTPVLLTGVAPLQAEIARPDAALLRGARPSGQPSPQRPQAGPP